MVSSTSSANKSWLPDDFGDLLITTASKMSVALQVTTLVQTDSNEFRIPLITGEAGAGWYDENADISPTDANFGEEVVRPRKTAGLSKISNELADDTTPAAAEQIGQSIARSIATGIDAAFFGVTPGTGVPPKGIGAFTDAEVTTITGPAAWADVDPFTEAVFAAENVGARLTSFIANPADAELLAKLKRETGSNEPLLSPDPTTPTTRRIAGVPLWTSSAVPEGTVYGIDAARTYTVVRKGTEVEMDRSGFFGSYSTAVRAVARVAFGYPQAKSIVRIKLAAA